MAGYEDKIKTLHPQGKQGISMDRHKYDVLRAAILKILNNTDTMKPMALLHAAADEVGSDFEGSAAWYGESVKLDMEARGELEHDRKKGILWLKK